MSTTFVICIAWAISMGITFNIALSSANYTHQQWRERMRISLLISIIISILYAWALVRLSSSRDDPHEELMLSPAADALIGSA